MNFDLRFSNNEYRMSDYSFPFIHDPEQGPVDKRGVANSIADGSTNNDDSETDPERESSGSEQEQEDDSASDESSTSESSVFEQQDDSDTDPHDSWKAYLADNGFVVLTDVLSPKQGNDACDKYSQIITALDKISRNDPLYSLAKTSDAADQKQVKSEFLNCREQQPIAHSPVQWKMREIASEVYAQLYDCRSFDLASSFEGFTWFIEKTKRSLWTSQHPKHDKLHSVEGLLNLSENGSFVCVPASHKCHHDFVGKLLKDTPALDRSVASGGSKKGSTNKMSVNRKSTPVKPPLGKGRKGKNIIKELFSSNLCKNNSTKGAQNNSKQDESTESKSDSDESSNTDLTKDVDGDDQTDKLAIVKQHKDDSRTKKIIFTDRYIDKYPNVLGVDCMLHVFAPKNSLILFDSRLFHGYDFDPKRSSEGINAFQHVCYVPKDDVTRLSKDQSNAIMSTRNRLWNNRECSKHHPGIDICSRSVSMLQTSRIYNEHFPVDLVNLSFLQQSLLFLDELY